VNSSGAAHARNARRLVQATRKHDRRLAAALLAAALAHTPEAEEVLRGARTRMARKPSALARELLRNFPKGRRRRAGRRRRGKGGGEADGAQQEAVANGNAPDDAVETDGEGAAQDGGGDGAKEKPRRSRSRRRGRGGRKPAANADPGEDPPATDGAGSGADEPAAA
jgi:hypothetical protein